MQSGKLSAACRDARISQNAVEKLCASDEDFAQAVDDAFDTFDAAEEAVMLRRYGIIESGKDDARNRPNATKRDT